MTESDTKTAGMCVHGLRDRDKWKFGTLAADSRWSAERIRRRKYIRTVYKLLKNQFQIKRFDTDYSYYTYY